MATSTFGKFNQFVQDVSRKVHDLGADSIKYYLSNTAPVAGNSIKTDIAEIATGNGYTGPQAITITSCTQTAGLLKLVLADPGVITATGAVGPFRYAVIYNDTPTSPVDPLIGFYDYGAAITLQSGETFTLDLDQANGTLTFQ